MLTLVLMLMLMLMLTLTLTVQPHQVSSSLSSSASLRGSQPTLADCGLSTESLLQAKRLGMASLDMARYYISY